MENSADCNPAAQAANSETRGRRRFSFKPRKGPITRDEPSRQQDPRIRRKPEISGEPDFSPKNLSTSFTTPKNDPCDIDAFSVADLAALGFLKRVPELRLNYSGYFDLVESLYRDLMSQDRYWVRTVTEPMWVYYCTMLLWERLYFIRSLQNEIPMTAYIDFKSHMPTGICIPKAIAVYLSSIGPVRDPNSRKWHVSVPELDQQVVNDVAGFFGQIAADTHHLYGSIPSPGLAAFSVLYEVANPQGVEMWRPPVGIAPADALNALQPTRSLLAYVPRSGPISQEIRNIYAELGLEADYNADTQDLENVVFGRNYHGLPFCIDLLRHISTKVADAKIPSIIGPVETEVGSQTQLGYISANDDQLPPNLRPTQGIVSTRCYTQLISLRATAVAVFKPRVEYANIPRNYIYRFQDDAIPPGWIATRNTQFAYGRPEWINMDTFGLSDVDGRAVVNEYIKNISRR